MKDIAALGFKIDASGAAAGRKAVQDELKQIDASAKTTSDGLKKMGHDAGEGLKGLAESVEHVSSKLGPLGKGGEEATRIFGAASGVFSLFTRDTSAAAAGQAQLDAAFRMGSIGANTLAAAQVNASEAMRMAERASVAVAAAEAKRLARQEEALIKQASLTDSQKFLTRERERYASLMNSNDISRIWANEESAAKRVQEATAGLAKDKAALGSANAAAGIASKELTAAKNAEAQAAKGLAEAEKLVASGQATAAGSSAMFAVGIGALITVVLAASVALKAMEEGIKLAFEGIGASSKAEDAIVGLKRVAGGLHEAEAIYKSFQEYSATHSFLDVDTLTKEYTALRNVGVGLNDTKRILDTFSAVGAGNVDPAGSVDRMTQAWSRFEARAESGGKVGARQFTMLAREGLDLSQMLSTTLNISIEKVNERIAKGTLDINDMRIALLAFKAQNPQVWADAELRAGTYKTILGNLKQTWEQVLESFGHGITTNPQVLSSLQEFRNTIEGLKTPAEHLGEVVAHALADGAKQGGKDIEAALKSDAPGQALAGVLIKWVSQAASSIDSIVTDAILGSISKSFSEGIANMKAKWGDSYLFNPTQPLGGPKSKGVGGSWGPMSDEAPLMGDTSPAVSVTGAAPSDTINKPPPLSRAGGGKGSDGPKDAVTTWDKLNKLVTDYNSGLYAVQKGEMTMAELMDKFAAEGSKAFSKVYDHQLLQQYINATLTGNAKILASALNMESARVQAAKKADQDIQLGIASTTEAAIRGLQKATDAYRNWSMVTADLVQGATEQFASGFSSAFASFANGSKSAKAAFIDFAKSFADSITQMIAKALILKAINSLIGLATGGGGANNGGGLSNSFNFGGSTGGVVGGLSEVYATNSDTFLGAKHYAQGGGVGIIAHEGEVILNQAQQKNVASSMGGGVTVNLSVNNNGGNSDDNERIQKALIRELPGYVKGVIANEKRQGGSLSRASILGGR